MHSGVSQMVWVICTSYLLLRQCGIAQTELLKLDSSRHSSVVLHPRLVYSGASPCLVKDGWSQLQSPPQCSAHLSAVCIWIMQESSVIPFTALDNNSERGGFVMMAALITGLITATVNHLSLLLWKHVEEGERWFPWQQTQYCLLCFFFSQPQWLWVCMHYPDYLAPQSPVPEVYNIWMCMKASLILCLVSIPGVVFVRLGLLPPVIMLPVNVQLHREPAGLLFPAAARDSGVCHYDPPRHGGSS